MITCQQITELVDDYLDGRMSLWTRLRFRMHLGMCEHCRAYLKQIEITRASLGKLPAPEMPAEVEAELLRRFRNWKPAGPEKDDDGA